MWIRIKWLPRTSANLIFLINYNRHTTDQRFHPRDCRWCQYTYEKVSRTPVPTAGIVVKKLMFSVTISNKVERTVLEMLTWLNRIIYAPNDTVVYFNGVSFSSQHVSFCTFHFSCKPRWVVCFLYKNIHESFPLVTPLVQNAPAIGGFPSQMAGNTENVSKS